MKLKQYPIIIQILLLKLTLWLRKWKM